MAVTLTITEAYATLAEAEVYMENNSVWIAETSDENKQDALMWARYYIETLYDYDLDSIDSIDEEAKLANCVLAADYIENGKLFYDDEKPIQSESVKADVVSQTIVYDTSFKPLPKSIGKMMALMDRIADRKNGSSVSLIRA